MRVAFDQQVFLLQEYGGISRYFCSLVKQLQKIENVEPQIFAPLHFNRNLAALQLAGAGRRYLLPKLNTKVFRAISYLSEFLSHRSINRFKPDIIHETYFSNNAVYSFKAKRVLTVYDLIHERYPSLFRNSHMTSGPKKAAANRVDHVICISESTRRDVIEYCDVAPEKTSVIYLGVDTKFIQMDSQAPLSKSTERPFFLYVGARRGYKNFGLFIRAFASSKWLKSEMDIICFGGGALQREEMELAAHLGLREGQLTQLGGEDAVLVQLYRLATALVYPSLYEGFGIPPLEAMAAGCPVLSSNTSSLPEVVGGAGEYFDPNDEVDIMRAMERVVGSPSRRAELIALGLQQYRKFTWQKCAEETHEIYRKLL